MLKSNPFRLAGIASALSIIASIANAETYVYDSLGRLVQVVQDTGQTVNYSLDLAGNRTSVSSPAARLAGCAELNAQPLTWTVAGKTCTSGDSFVPAIGAGSNQSIVDPGRFIWTGTATYTCTDGARVLQSASCG
jgi:YD repeat-containing protein